MAGVASAGVTTTVSHGPKSPYDVNTFSNQSRPPGLRQLSPSSARTPLSSLPPNRKDNGVHGRPAHNRVGELGQNQGNLTRSGSEADSLLDLYGNNASSGNVSRQPSESDVPENMYRPEDDDPEGWIHRDKLAKIESEELQAAGINLAKAKRNVNSGGTQDIHLGRQTEPRSASQSGRHTTEEERPRLDEGEEDEDDRTNWDLRTPEEIAADHESPRITHTPMLKKSGSKIPVLTSSPLPIPQDKIDRDTPLARKRTISNSMSPEEGIPVLRPRKRRGSTGSHPGQTDTGSHHATPVSINGSRRASKTASASPTKTKPKTGQPSPPGTSAGRKVSTTSRKPSSNVKTGQGGSPSVGQRPGTRSGELDRPRTAVNRPEGDPPWLATMYKPDPRLPPEEQIIPTHARRQQQAQWEQQGAIPTTYDRNFSPLAIHTGNGLIKAPSPVSSPSPSSERQEVTSGEGPWPLKPVPSYGNSVGARPGTSGSNRSNHGGYTTMPKVTSPAIVQSPRMGNVSTMPAQPSRSQVQRQEHNDAEEKVKDKSCGCCIVM
ncbi:hypothetical protein HRR83_007014 [Exophiala dermatitidis]|uniref:Uncharacterized protein n=1 Tax=Exophiala dermatitidis TaxID=5970 RepID=A0AAN6EQC1_EXODE|nr:hypothetical protein HRR75_005797 [Exophiala dermatitidis]KAJ4512498.1 hypothetical protein HRR73_006053 [Exophiala dermatitidis]KAJ4512628.1 hypothetical protein HRR74_006326 [Exophiala dermatitidis]KAJ4542428.1 hypothetical protein HRR77_005630 [Exophiala dermatitidis]KAJ4546636.1 hypothetical protein HRR78_005637 [Exophiala dermatitidis]